MPSSESLGKGSRSTPPTMNCGAKPGEVGEMPSGSLYHSLVVIQPPGTSSMACQGSSQLPRPAACIQPDVSVPATFQTPLTSQFPSPLEWEVVGGGASVRSGCVPLQRIETRAIA